MQGSCLEQQVVVLHCRDCKGASHSTFLASLAMEFVISGKDELQGQGNKCFLMKPCHPPGTLQWPAAAVEGGVFPAFLAGSQCEPLVSKEVIKAIAGSLHGCLVHHEQPHRSCADWFCLLCISLWTSPFLWCSSDFDPHCRSSSWTILASMLQNCCLFSLLPCLLHQNRASNRHFISHCGFWTYQDYPLRLDHHPYVSESYMPTECPLQSLIKHKMHCLWIFANGGATENNPIPKILSPTQNTLWHVLLGSAEPIPTSSNGCKPLSTTTMHWTFHHSKCL